MILKAPHNLAASLFPFMRKDLKWLFACANIIISAASFFFHEYHIVPAAEISLTIMEEKLCVCLVVHEIRICERQQPEAYCIMYVHKKTFFVFKAKKEIQLEEEDAASLCQRDEAMEIDHDPLFDTHPDCDGEMGNQICISHRPQRQPRSISQFHFALSERDNAVLLRKADW